MHSPSLEASARGLASEMKFLLDLETAGKIREWSRVHMAPDPHGSGPHSDEYTIHTIYLDTPELSVLRREGRFARGKFRIRRYGQSDSVFVERKLKKKGRVRKRRTLVAQEALGVLEGLPTVEYPGFWFHRRIADRAMKPVCQVAYARTARMLKGESGTLRLTIDTDLAACAADGFRFGGPHGWQPLLEGRAVMEMKFVHPMPDLFAEVVARFELTPAVASKYRMAGAALNLGETEPCLSF